MERRSGLWIASTPQRKWVVQSRPITTRKSDVNLHFDGGLFQLWEGFGGGVSEKGWSALAILKAGDRLRAIHALFSHEEGCKLHYGRLPIGVSGAAHNGYSLSAPHDLAMKTFTIVRDREGLIPFLRIPLNRIQKFKTVACPWSPPEWMKENGETGSGQIKWAPEILEAYALYLARFIQSYRREGILIDHLLLQNEPADKMRQPGCYWTGPQLRDFIRNYCGPVMKKQKISVRIWLGALDSPDYAAYALSTLSDPMARQFIAGVACQHGGLSTLSRIRRAFPDIPLMLSDCGDGDGLNTWAQGHATFEGVQRAITAGVATCLYDNMVLGSGGKTMNGSGLNSLVAVNEVDQSYSLTPDYFVLRHFSCFVDRYAVRLGLQGEWADRAVAFHNPDDDSRVLVVHNPEMEHRRLVLEDGDRRLVMLLQPQSFNTIVL